MRDDGVEPVVAACHFDDDENAAVGLLFGRCRRTRQKERRTGRQSRKTGRRSSQKVASFNEHGRSPFISLREKSSPFAPRKVSLRRSVPNGASFRGAKGDFRSQSE